jgi:hypothetical protein
VWDVHQPVSFSRPGAGARWYGTGSPGACRAYLPGTAQGRSRIQYPLALRPCKSLCAFPPKLAPPLRGIERTTSLPENSPSCPHAPSRLDRGRASCGELRFFDPPRVLPAPQASPSFTDEANPERLGPGSPCTKISPPFPSAQGRFTLAVAWRRRERDDAEVLWDALVGQDTELHAALCAPHRSNSLWGQGKRSCRRPTR